ncbi:MAG: hypothetical protein KVP17_005311, partial [Porospora cf. gigantea B]|uniref:uncharacterized protein n=1 Tax=Porospora cf. gigantea B TaxID=2853592 RepID=UPI003571CAF4
MHTVVLCLLSLASAKLPEWFNQGGTEDSRPLGGNYSLREFLDVPSCTLPPECATCPLKFEILHLQDRTGSFQPFLERLHDVGTDLLDYVQERWPESVYGLSTFGDKPLPYLGF